MRDRHHLSTPPIPLITHLYEPPRRSSSPSSMTGLFNSRARVDGATEDGARPVLPGPLRPLHVPQLRCASFPGSSVSSSSSSRDPPGICEYDPMATPIPSRWRLIDGLPGGLRSVGVVGNALFGGGPGLTTPNRSNDVRCRGIRGVRGGDATLPSRDEALPALAVPLGVVTVGDLVPVFKGLGRPLGFLSPPGAGIASSPAATPCGNRSISVSGQLPPAVRNLRSRSRAGGLRGDSLGFGNLGVGDSSGIGDPCVPIRLWSSLLLLLSP